MCSLGSAYEYNSNIIIVHAWMACGAMFVV